jgi:hypothetical protein
MMRSVKHRIPEITGRRHASALPRPGAASPAFTTCRALTAAPALLLLLAGGLMLPRAAAQRPPVAVPGVPLPPVKPGFEFRLDEYATLVDYDFRDPDNPDDELVDERIGQGILARRLSLISADGSSNLFLLVGAAQRPWPGPRVLIEEFTTESQMLPEDRLIPGERLGIFIGDESLVGRNSRTDFVADEIAFRRQNIVVFLQHTSDDDDDGPSPNLKPIAEEIDGAIASLPDTNWPHLVLERPKILEFSAAKSSLKPYEETELRLRARNRWGDPLLLTYLEPDGDVLRGDPDRYIAVSKEGTQTLTLIVSRPNLLFDVATIEFDVAP